MAKVRGKFKLAWDKSNSFVFIIQCLFYIWKVVLSISKGFHLLLDIKLKSLKLFENASIPFEDNLVIH